MKKTFLNKITSIVLTLSLVLAPLPTWGQTAAVDYRKQVGNLVYSLKTLEDGSILKKFSRLDEVAGKALTAQLAAEVIVNQLTALELLKIMIEDPKFPMEEKSELVKNLIAAIGRNFSTMNRHQGDDALDPELRKLPVALDFAKKVGLEEARTVLDLVTFPKTADGDRAAKIKDRMFREYIGQDGIIEFQKTIVALQKRVGDNEAFNAFKFDLVVPDKEKENPTDLGTAEKALIVRQNRLNAHYFVLGTIAVGTMGWMLSGVDFVGLFTRAYNENSLKVSDFIAYSGFATLAAIRAASGSFGAVPRLKTLIEMIKHPESNPEISVLKLPLISRLFRIEKKVEAEKAKLLDPNWTSKPEKPKKPDADSPNIFSILTKSCGNIIDSLRSRFKSGSR